MNKKIKILLLALGVVSLAAVGISASVFLFSQSQIAEYAEKEAKLKQENAYLKEKLDSSQKDVRSWREKSEQVTSTLDRLDKEHVLLVHQRDSLLQEKDILAQENKKLSGELEKLNETYSQAKQQAQMVASDEFLASLLEDKARLEVEIERIKGKASLQQAKLQDAQKQTLLFESLQEDRQAMDERLEDAKTISETLSKELLAAKKEVAVLGQELAKAKEQFGVLAQERDGLSKQLAKMKQILQQRLVELNQAKKVLEEAAAEADEVIQKEGAVSIQLSPIVVKAENKTSVSSLPVVSAPMQKALELRGRIIKVNDKYKFVVIDIGSNNGIEEGMDFDVYRQQKKIGMVEVIEVHKNVSACDVKQMSVRSFNLRDTVHR